jgi:recombination protein RecR
MRFSPYLEQLIKAFTRLPGIGPKSAQRIAFYLLERNREAGRQLAHHLQLTMESIRNCSRCRIFSEQAICEICNDPRRDASKLCIVGSPMDVQLLEHIGSYQGRYFVLLGYLSPIDGIGPEQIGIDIFAKLLEEQASNLQEIILATSTTVAGEATAYYLAELIKPYQIFTSRIAYGVPMGGELEYLDGNTVIRALEQRRAFADS